MLWTMVGNIALGLSFLLFKAIGHYEGLTKRVARKTKGLLIAPIEFYKAIF